MKIAIVHEWLVNFGGSERVLEQLISLYPEAKLFAVVDFLDEKTRALLHGKHATTTFIQRLPGAKSHYRRYLSLMPLAIEQLDLSSFDLIISSSHAVAKGVITGPDQLHVSYTHSPMRYAWDLQHQYLRESRLTAGPMSWAVRLLLHKMRIWDARSANGVDAFVANSQYIARRIEKTYRREATVIYPPVDLEFYSPAAIDREDFYLAASRMVPYKRMPLIIEAFNTMPHRKLVVVGDGPDFSVAKSIAGPNVELVGSVSSLQLRDYMRRARAFVFAAEEDFGITLLEAQACGTPVIAYRKGGASETVLTAGQSSEPTGILFEEQRRESLISAVERFEALHPRIDPADCIANASHFSAARFREEFSAFVDAQIESRFHSAPRSSGMRLTAR